MQRKQWGAEEAAGLISLREAERDLINLMMQLQKLKKCFGIN